MAPQTSQSAPPRSSIAKTHLTLAALAVALVVGAAPARAQLPPAPADAPPPDGSGSAYVRVIDLSRGVGSETLRLDERGLRFPTYDDAVVVVVWSPAIDFDHSGVGDTIVSVAPGETVALPPPSPDE